MHLDRQASVEVCYTASPASLKRTLSLRLGSVIPLRNLRTGRREWRHGSYWTERCTRPAHLAGSMGEEYTRVPSSAGIPIKTPWHTSSSQHQIWTQQWNNLFGNCTQTLGLSVQQLKGCWPAAASMLQPLPHVEMPPVVIWTTSRQKFSLSWHSTTLVTVLNRTTEDGSSVQQTPAEAASGEVRWALVLCHIVQPCEKPPLGAIKCRATLVHLDSPNY